MSGKADFVLLAPAARLALLSYFALMGDRSVCVV